MDIKLPDAFFTPDSRSGFQPGGFSDEILQSRPNAAFPSPVEAVNDASNTEPQIDEEDYEILVALMDQTAELLSHFDRKLKYEVIEDAGIVQIQVIDNRDGRVLRKIPADEVIKFVESLREQLDNHMDIRA
ncbi:MAG: flagellar protein FlaG [Synergistaceae bacterium]|nr:flagellar protein FlaG [Synergistaceae bacterium]